MCYWGEPKLFHINCDNFPCVWNNGIYPPYVSFILCLSHPGSCDLCAP